MAKGKDGIVSLMQVGTSFQHSRGNQKKTGSLIQLHNVNLLPRPESVISVHSSETGSPNLAKDKAGQMGLDSITRSPASGFDSQPACEADTAPAELSGTAFEYSTVFIKYYFYVGLAQLYAAVFDK